MTTDKNRNRDQKQQGSQKDSTSVEKDDARSVSNDNEDLGDKPENEDPDDEITQRNPRHGGEGEDRGSMKQGGQGEGRSSMKQDGQGGEDRERSKR